MKPALLDTQKRGPEDPGSWDPVVGASARTDRLRTTALYALCLQVYTRYQRVDGRE